MISEKEIRKGKEVLYCSFYDSETGERSTPQEAVITSEPFEMCGTTCCFIDVVSSCVDIENLFER